MNDSPMFQALSAIQATVQQHLASNQGVTTTQHAPSFDPRTVHSPLKSSLPVASNQLTSLGLPVEAAAEINALLSAESTNYQSFVAYKKQQLLGELSAWTVSSNPSALPSLVEAASQAFYNATIDACLGDVRKHLEELSLGEGTLSDNEALSDSEASSSCDGDEASDDEAEEMEEAEEDDNAPMKAGEEVPPLETKYLPIFEALHERGKVLTKPEKTYLVNMTGMTYRQITIWFQNRRRGELKEDMNRASSSRADSVHSFTSSDASGDEINLERQLSNAHSDTTFDIRSWRLTSAFPAKDGLRGPSIPPSPTKSVFGPTAISPNSDTDDTDLSDDSDDDAELPPGLRVPSLCMSTTTIDSINASATSSQVLSAGISDPAIVTSNTSGVHGLTSSRPIKPLPSSRLRSPPAHLQPTQNQQAQVFPFNFNGTTPTPTNNQSMPSSIPSPAPPPHLVTSNERGLTVQMDITPPASIATLQAPTIPFVPVNHPTSTPPSTSPVSPSNSAGSPPRNTSPTPSGHSASSPRPPVKPLPRRTGCAPRPRPPPRAGPTSAPVSTSTTIPASSRASIVLPPSSNPSLGNTTLGTLLRPNPPAPKIPAEMEERLAAMASRMGVANSLNLESGSKRNGSIDVPALARSAAASAGGLPTRDPRLFGPAQPPRTSVSSGPTLAPISGQMTQHSTSPAS